MRHLRDAGAHDFRLDQGGKAEVTLDVQTWSPLDGDDVRQCPTYAISVRPEGTAA